MSDEQDVLPNEIQRLYRIILESFEVALFTCNTHLHYCGPTLLADIFKQILPTAYYVNTGYWPFYQTEEGWSSCVCDIIGITCVHEPSEDSCINMNRYREDYVIFKDSRSRFEMENVVINVWPTSDDCQTSQLIVVRYQIKLCYGNLEIEDDAMMNPMFYSAFRCSMRPVKLNEEKQITHFFKVHPLSIPLYGSYFKFLKRNFKIHDVGPCHVMGYLQFPEATLCVEQYVNGTIEIITEHTFDRQSYDSDNRFLSDYTDTQLESIYTKVLQTTSPSSWAPIP